MKASRRAVLARLGILLAGAGLAAGPGQVLAAPSRGAGGPPLTHSDAAGRLLVPREAAAPWVPAPLIVPRFDWGADPPAGPYRRHQPRRLTVHHTAARWSGGNTAAHLRVIQQFHQGRERGWVDVAYHFLIDRDGTIYEGRPLSVAPDTATEYNPAGHLTICLLGHFDVQRPAWAQMDALAGTLAWLADSYTLPLRTLGGHRDYAATTCPGRFINSYLASGALDEMVAERLGYL